MSANLVKTILIFLFFGGFVFVNQAQAQDSQPQERKINFGYSRNPKTKVKTPIVESNSTTSAEMPSETEEKLATVENKNETTTDFESRSAAKKTLEIAKKNSPAASPTEIYKVGIGDVLFINLQNTPSKSSNYFTVLNDGTIDYPLVGEMIPVADLSVEEIEDLLREKIKLYESPQVTVKVREYASHSIKVFGLVEKPGEQFMQREAKPLFVVRAEAIVQSKANRAVIKRSNSTTETFDLNDPKYEDVLVFAGDIVEFNYSADEEKSTAKPKYYYIGGNVNLLGQKDFYTGITLTQAILASGGVRRGNAKKVTVRRKNEEGLLKSFEYNLKAIKDGKEPDPLLEAGDTIEVEN